MRLWISFLCAAFFSSFSKPPPSFTFFDFFLLLLLSSVAYDKREWRKTYNFHLLWGESSKQKIRKKSYFKFESIEKTHKFHLKINLRRFFNPFFWCCYCVFCILYFFSLFLMSKSNQFVYMCARMSLEEWNEWQKKKKETFKYDFVNWNLLRNRIIFSLSFRLVSTDEGPHENIFREFNKKEWNVCVS